MRTPLLVILAAVPLAFGAVDNPTCEKTGPETYKISFEVSGANERVAVYASSSADRITKGSRVLATTGTSPVVVTVNAPNRVYFHLKPRHGNTRVVAVRRVDLEGTYNTRDLGGYRAADGRYVRWGAVYRSDQLHDLSDNDVRYFTALGVKLVCDFRVEPEIAHSPTDFSRFPATTFTNLNIDSYGGRYGQPPRGASGGRGASGRGGFGASGAAGGSGRGAAPPRPYDWLALAAPQYSKVLHRMAAGELPALFHCFAGKDRTGVMAAIILSILGVPRDVMMKDYMLTNEIPDEKLPMIAKGFARRGDNISNLDTVRRGSMVNSGQMEATFAMLDKNNGSVVAWVQKEMGITDAELSVLRNRLLER